MGFDPLLLNRKRLGGGSTESPPPTRLEYTAFHARDQNERVKIRRANGPTHTPPYSYLLDVVYEEDPGTSVTLVFTFLMVHVRGRNLQPVIAALEMGSAEFIQEFNTKKWSRPKDDAAPFIESIKVIFKENGPVFSDGDKLPEEQSVRT